MMEESGSIPLTKKGSGSGRPKNLGGSSSGSGFEKLVYHNWAKYAGRKKPHPSVSIARILEGLQATTTASLSCRQLIYSLAES